MTARDEWNGYVLVGAKCAGVASEQLAQGERTSASEDVREHWGQRTHGRRRRHDQVLLLRGRSRQTTHAQHLYTGAQVASAFDAYESLSFFRVNLLSAAAARRGWILPVSLFSSAGSVLTISKAKYRRSIFVGRRRRTKIAREKFGQFFRSHGWTFNAQLLLARAAKDGGFFLPSFLVWISITIIGLIPPSRQHLVQTKIFTMSSFAESLCTL